MNRLIRELKDELLAQIESMATSMVKLLPYSNNSADGGSDKVQGYPTEGTDEKPYDFEGRRVWPFGIRSRPPVGTFGVWIGQPGRSGDGVIVGAESSRFGPSDLADGEVAIYNKVTGMVIRLGADGKVTIQDGNGNAGVYVPTDLWVQHFMSSQSSGPPTCSDGRISIDPTSTDASGSFTISGYSTSPPADKSLGQTINYARGYKTGSRVLITPGDDVSAGLVAPKVTNSGADDMNTVVYCTSSNASGFTIQNRSIVGASTGPALAGTWNYWVVGR